MHVVLTIMFAKMEFDPTRTYKVITIYGLSVYIKIFDMKSLYYSLIHSHFSYGAFQMPTRPSSSAAASESASTLTRPSSGGGGGRANLRNVSVTFSLFWHETSLK